jgi:monovalent cation/hydrogen antiporter
MPELKLVLGLLGVVVALAALARRLEVPYPILLVLGGLVIGLVPGLPHVELAPELVFVLFVPPLLLAGGFFTSIRDFKANARPIGLLAVGLVLATAVVVAVVTHALIPSLGWGAAFALGAIVSPTDELVATAIAQRLGAPRRLVTVLDGESLVNDATALFAYRVAVAAAVSGAFSLGEAALKFPVVALGGVAIGLAVGWVVTELWRRLHDATLSITLSLLAPFAAYLPAEELHVSGELAAVVTGIYLGWRDPRIVDSDQRVKGLAVWELLVFVINGLIFILIGLQLPNIVADLAADRALLPAVGLGLVVSLTVILVRLAWIFPAAYLPRWASLDLRQRDPYPPWQNMFVVGWAGMRGVISLAAALALPLTRADGSPFPERDLLIFLTFCVILVTLVGQGLTFPWVLRRLVVHDDPSAEREELAARTAAAEAALARIDGLASEWPTHRELLDQLRDRYEHRSHHIAPSLDGSDDAVDRELLEHQAIRREVSAAERDAVLELRDRGRISDEVLRRIERELDLEELRMEA